MIHTTAEVEHLAVVRFHPLGHRRRGCGLEARRPGLHRHPYAAGGHFTGRLHRRGVEAVCLIDEPGSGLRGGPGPHQSGRGCAGAELAKLPGASWPSAMRPRLCSVCWRCCDRGAAAGAGGRGAGRVCGRGRIQRRAGAPGFPLYNALGPKGGSALAASIVNALAILAEEGEPSCILTPGLFTALGWDRVIRN